MNNKKSYEGIEIILLSLTPKDVIATSGAFDGKDDNIINW